MPPAPVVVTVSADTVYLFGDRPVRTSLSLSELPQSEHPHPEDSILVDWAAPDFPEWTAQDWVHDWCDDDEFVTLTLARWGKHFRLDFPDLCEFILQHDRRTILVRPRCELDATTLEHLLVDQVLPRYLAHEGRLLAHASAVTVAGGCVLFLGKSGWGKSTLAGLLDGLGHALLSDDCVLLDTSREPPCAMATYASLRLNPDSLANAFHAVPATSPVANYTDKRRLALPSRPLAAAMPVRAIYLLNDPAVPAADVRIQPCNAAALCVAMIRHSFQLDVSDAQCARRLLSEASALARGVPGFGLDYPRDFPQAPRVSEAVKRHLDSLAPAHLET